MTNLTPERREENMRLREAATPGRWIADHRARCAGIYAGERVNCFDEVERFIAYRNHAADLQDEKDWSYIVAACNDLPLYESHIVELEAAVAEREKEIERLNAQLTRAAIKARGVPIDPDWEQQHDALVDLYDFLSRIRSTP